MKLGVSLAYTIPFPSLNEIKSAINLTISGSVYLDGTISINLIYLGGLKKCVIRNLFLKSSGTLSAIAFIDRPLVLDVSIVSCPIFGTTFSLSRDFLISKFSTTTSMTQSQSFILCISSSKLPISMFLM